MIGMAMALAVMQAGGIAPDVRLDAFRRMCVPHRRDLAATALALEAAGWTPAGEDDHPELAASVARVRAEAADPGLPISLDYSIWASEADGRRLHIVLTRVEAVLREADFDDDGDGEIQPWERRDVLVYLGCGVWDFEATAPVHPGLMTAWVGAPAVQTFDQPGVVEGGTWNVHAILPGTGEVHLGFIPDGSPMVEQTGFSGVAISMTTAPEADAGDTPRR